jgi:hypothetical protein
MQFGMLFLQHPSDAVQNTPFSPPLSFFNPAYLGETPIRIDPLAFGLYGEGG